MKFNKTLIFVVALMFISLPGSLSVTCGNPSGCICQTTSFTSQNFNAIYNDLNTTFNGMQNDNNALGKRLGKKKNQK